MPVKKVIVLHHVLVQKVRELDSGLTTYSTCNCLVAEGLMVIPCQTSFELDGWWPHWPGGVKCANHLNL